MTTGRRSRWRAPAIPGVGATYGAGPRHAPPPALWINQQWDAACKAAGCPEKLFYDFRRTAYRNMIDAGVDPFTAMDLVGHKTMSMAKRYAIRNTKAMGRALAQTQAYLAQASN